VHGFFKTRAVPFLVPSPFRRSLRPRRHFITTAAAAVAAAGCRGFNDLTAKNRARRPRDTTTVDAGGVVVAAIAAARVQLHRQQPVELFRDELPDALAGEPRSIGESSQRVRPF